MFVDTRGELKNVTTQDEETEGLILENTGHTHCQSGSLLELIELPCLTRPELPSEGVERRDCRAAEQYEATKPNAPLKLLGRIFFSNMNSPVCDRVCIFRFSRREKLLLQVGQWCGFSLVCVRI